jgi:hypothetical protein
VIELPQMVHPLSKYWSQPSRHQVAVYDDIAIMDRSTLARMADYSLSIPTGAYEGKMWRQSNGGSWRFCWYGPSDDPDKVSIHSRPIRLIRDEDRQE